MVGVRAWKGGAASDALFEALQPSFDARLPKGSWSYTSVDMKRGIDLVEMCEFKDDLTALMKLDPRGGHFLQPDMEEAIKRLSVRPTSVDLFKSLSDASSDESIRDTVTRIAYSYRVMLSHVREKYKGYNKIDKDPSAATTHPDWLKNIYEIMADVVQDEGSSGFPRRVHPCPAFRQEEEAEVSAAPDCVFKQMEFDDTMAKATMSYHIDSNIYSVHF